MHAVGWCEVELCKGAEERSLLPGHLFALESVVLEIAGISVEGNLHTTQNGNILRVCDRRSSQRVASSGWRRD